MLAVAPDALQDRPLPLKNFSVYPVTITNLPYLFECSHDLFSSIP